MVKELTQKTLKREISKKEAPEGILSQKSIQYLLFLHSYWKSYFSNPFDFLYKVKFKRIFCKLVWLWRPSVKSFSPSSVISAHLFNSTICLINILTLESLHWSFLNKWIFQGFVSKSSFHYWWFSYIYQRKCLQRSNRISLPFKIQGDIL